MERVFPDIFNLVLHQQNTIAEMWTSDRWSLNFRRHFNDWEVQRVADFLSKLDQFPGVQAAEDHLWWQGNSKGIFKVYAAYKIMNQSNHQIANWPWKQIWRIKVPHKVSIFVWLLAKEATLTVDNLMSRGMTLCSRCFLCKEIAETVNHLFLHCPFTAHLWRIILNRKGIAWTMPGKITEALSSWEGICSHAKDRSRWRIVPACIWWTIWKERNSRCFESLENDVQKIKLNFILLLCFWCNQIYSNDTVSIIDVLDSL